MVGEVEMPREDRANTARINIYGTAFIQQLKMYGEGNDTTLPLGGSKVQVGPDITGVTTKTEIDNAPPAGEAFYQAEKQ